MYCPSLALSMASQAKPRCLILALFPCFVWGGGDLATAVSAEPIVYAHGSGAADSWPAPLGQRTAGRQGEIFEGPSANMFQSSARGCSSHYGEAQHLQQFFRKFRPTRDRVVLHGQLLRVYQEIQEPLICFRAGELSASPREWRFALCVRVKQLELELALGEVPATCFES